MQALAENAKRIAARFWIGQRKEDLRHQHKLFHDVRGCTLVRVSYVGLAANKRLFRNRRKFQIQTFKQNGGLARPACMAWSNKMVHVGP